MAKIEIKKPRDMHMHPRDWGLITLCMLEMFSKWYENFTVMTNIAGNPVDHYKRFQEFDHERLGFQLEEPWFQNALPTLMLTQKTSVKDIRACSQMAKMALKMIPGMASFGSDRGGLSLDGLLRKRKIFEASANLEIPFLGHWELSVENGKEVPFLNREARAIPLLERFVEKAPSDLMIVVEHVTTKEMVQFIKSGPKNLFGTITAHHLLLTHKDVLESDGKTIKDPLNFCLPVGAFLP